MAIVDSFTVNTATMDITMYAGDTGSFTFTAEKAGGDAWTEYDRALMTVTNAQGEIVLQRIYRLDDQWDLGDGVVLVEFHNDDTDSWPSGTYGLELRFDVAPVWHGTPSTARCVDARQPGAAYMIEGGNVKTKVKATITIQPVTGKI